MQFKNKRPETANIPYSITIPHSITNTKKTQATTHKKTTQAESGQWDT